MLGAGYADTGRRFVRLLHPAADIIAVLIHTKNNDSFIWHFSEVAKRSRRKSSIIKLLEPLFRAESLALLKITVTRWSESGCCGAAPCFSLATCCFNSSFVILQARLQVKFQASVRSPRAKRYWLQPDEGTEYCQPTFLEQITVLIHDLSN